MTAMNAFTMVRPRGPDIDIPATTKRKTTNTSKNSQFGDLKALDRNGRLTVAMPPRTTGAISLNASRQSAATLAKQARAGSKAGTR